MARSRGSIGSAGSRTSRGSMRHGEEYGDSGWQHYNPFDEKSPRDNFSPNDSFGPRDSDRTLLQDDVPVRDSHRSGGGDEWREVDPGITRLQFDENEPSGRKKERIPENIETDVGLGEISVNIGIVPTDDIGSGLSVVVGVDVNPLQVDVNMNGDVGSASIGIGLPGDLLGLNAEISVDMDTGQRIGGGFGVEISGLDIGVNVVTHDGKTCTTVTATYFGVGASYTHCKEDDEEEEEEDPPPEPDPPPPNDDLSLPPPPYCPPIPGKPGDHVKLLFMADTAGKILEKYYQKGITGNFEITEKRLINSGGSGYKVKDYYPDGRPATYVFFERSTTTQTTYYNGSPSVTQSSTPYETDPMDAEYAMMAGEYSYIVAYCKAYGIGEVKFNNYSYSNGFGGNWWGNTIQQVGWIARPLVWAEVNGKPVELSPPEIPLPPEIPIHPPEKMPECCNLEPIMSLLRKVATVLDAENFNVQMPQSVILKEDGQELAPGVLQINNYAEFLNYLFQRDDERWGAFGISVKVEDTDPLTGGNQEKDFYLPNLAESIAEMYGILLQLAIDGQLQKHLAVKNLTEASKQAVTNTKNYYLLDAIADYLGFKTSEKNLMIPLLCKLAHDPEKEINMDEFITETETAAKVIEFADEGTLQTTLAELKQAAAIIRALHYRPVNPYGDINTQIKDYVMSKSPDNEKIWEKFVEKLSGEFLPDSDPNKGNNPNGPTIEEVPNI